MRNYITSVSAYSLIAFAADNETGSTSLLPSDSPAIGKTVLEPVEPVKPATAAIAAVIKADGEKRAAQRKLSGKAVKAASKPAKPSTASAKPATGKAADKPVTQHAVAFSYHGASPTFRQHDRKLSPIVLNRIPGSFTERDAAFLSDLYERYGRKPFKRFDADAGNVSRAIGHSYLTHVSGSLDSKHAEFAITETYVKQRKQSATAKPKA